MRSKQPKLTLLQRRESKHWSNFQFQLFSTLIQRREFTTFVQRNAFEFYEDEKVKLFTKLFVVLNYI